MLSEEEKEQILSELPNIKLSYENIIHKKVYSDFVLAIPEGKKCFAWFTNSKNGNVCYILELKENKQVYDIKIVNCCFNSSLSYGTIFYGTVFNNLGNNFFSVEDIFFYKGLNVSNYIWIKKLDLFDQIMDSLLKKVREFHYTIKGYDKAPSAVLKAKDNIKNANLEEYITIQEKNFFDTEKESKGPLHMVFNPPYGERLDIEMERFYREIGDTLKQNYPGTNAWFITANLEALKFVGLKPSRKIKLFNGSLEARMVKYEMYEGSKRAKFNSINND